VTKSPASFLAFNIHFFIEEYSTLHFFCQATFYLICQIRKISLF
jgi:hypothetical protein